MTDKPTDDNADEGPITPEVVQRRGAASRKRRPGGEPPIPSHEPEPERPSRAPTGTMFRIGCILLTTLGVLELFVASQLVIDPDQARCRAARFLIDDANDDDEDFNDVELPADDENADDVACDDAIQLAGNIPDEEGDEPDGTFADASSFRSQGLLIGGLGIAHGVTGFLTLRTRRRLFRNIALAFVAFGIFLPVLGIISLLILAFATFALVFSADAKAIFGTGPGFLRPRIPPPPTK